MNSYNFLLKKLGISEDLAPEIIKDTIPGSGDMAYLPNYNMIVVDFAKVNGKNDKTSAFSALRHELQHYIQNTYVLRHETIGEKAIGEYAKNFIITQRALVEQIVKLPDEEILKIPSANPQKLLAFKKLYNNNDTEGIEKMYQEMEAAYRPNLENFRNKLIEKYGILKSSNSSATKRAQQIFDEFMNVGYFKQGGQIDTKKYAASGIENEAIFSQISAGGEFGQTCPIKMLKEDFFKNLDQIKDDFD